MKTMTVQDLIDELCMVEDRTLPVYIWQDDNIKPIDMVDTSISDRVDINIGED